MQEPVFDDVANEVEQNRGAMLETIHRCGAFIAPAEQRNALRVCANRQVREQACVFVVGGSPSE